jgi:hypothetical protein
MEVTTHRFNVSGHEDPATGDPCGFPQDALLEQVLDSVAGDPGHHRNLTDRIHRTSFVAPM